MSEGTLNGDNVSSEEFRSAYMNTYLSLVMMMQRPLRITPEIDVEMRRAAWRRLASLRKAEELGLATTDQEVEQTILTHPGFTANGRFSEMQYNNFVNGFLANLGVSKRAFEEHVRQEIALQKLRSMVNQAVLVSPQELQRTFSALSDRFDLAYVAITTNQVADDVQLTEEDLKAYFEEDPEAFTIPPQVEVDYIAFPVSDYLAKAEISEEDALAYYDEHIDEYTEIVEVETEDVETDEEGDLEWDDETATETVTTPFEEVSNTVYTLLRRNLARSLAADDATDFLIQLTPDREGRAPSFRELASESDYAVKTIGPFSLAEELPGIDDTYTFNKAAFRLKPNMEDYFSDAVACEDAVYVLALTNQYDARIPEFEEVRDEVKLEAEAEALVDALIAKAEAVRDAARAAISNDVSFADAIQPFDLEITTVTNITISSGIEDEIYSDSILRGALTCNKGEVSDMIPVEDRILLTYVADRQPGETETFASLRPQIIESIRRERSRLFFEEWQESLLADITYANPEREGITSDVEEDVVEEDVVEEDLPEE
jgi:peptidyl-prolyl cis-trans isomerase D